MPSRPPSQQLELFDLAPYTKREHPTLATLPFVNYTGDETMEELRSRLEYENEGG